MVLTGLLAGTGAYYISKDRMQKFNFGDSINLIRTDNDSEWCKLANGQTIEGNSGGHFCAIQMGKYEGTKE